jgi:hypothetical protein
MVTTKVDLTADQVATLQRALKRTSERAGDDGRSEPPAEADPQE